MTWLRRSIRKPIAWLMAVALAAALFIFQDYGLTWDEPLFYGYADALGYAYSPAAWFSGELDLNLSYGPSGDDHKTRGPGYLLFARLPARVLQSWGLDTGPAWHLLNFGAFLLGIYFIYKISTWIAGRGAALLGAALFSLQPLLWGHAFVNPKDVPFMVLLAGSVWLGVRMVDRLADSQDAHVSHIAPQLLLPGFVLGVAGSNRVLGPLGGLLVGAYWLARRASWRAAAWFVAYVGFSVIVMFATWPYLWENPLNFFGTFSLMAQNPTVLPVLFGGSVYPANELPLRYLPVLLAATLTEPVWPLFAVGAVVTIWKARKHRGRCLRLAVLLSWLCIPIAYALAARPPLYDGMRHFLFVLPPAFALAAAGVDSVLQRISRSWIRIVFGVLVLVPGLAGIVTLHPYEYTYFNSLVGGTSGAFRYYETDYWLTCYKEAIERFNEAVADPTRLFVHREAMVAATYAAPHVSVMDERGAKRTIRAGDYVLVNTRTNEDLRVFPDAPELLSVARNGATFCIIKKVE